jgi:Uma2 family endonuclease
VHVPATRLFAYPDASVACGQRRYDAGDPPSLLNSAVLVEVTSDSTEDFDRGRKFLHYQSIRELSDYVIVSHRERRIDHFRREADDQWRLATYASAEARVELAPLGGAIALTDVYATVNFEEGRGRATAAVGLHRPPCDSLRFLTRP